MQPALEPSDLSEQRPYGSAVSHIASQFKRAGAEETATYVEQLFQEAHDAYVENSDKRRQGDLPTRARRFLHMKDVSFGNGTATTTLEFWRGSLADITGWSLGSATVQVPEN